MGTARGMASTLATLIRSALQPGDVVYVPENVDFWGIARCLKGPDWGRIDKGLAAYWNDHHRRGAGPGDTKDCAGERSAQNTNRQTSGCAALIR
jgi:hypothetical protein